MCKNSKVFAFFFFVGILFGCNKKPNEEQRFLEVESGRHSLNFGAETGYQTVTVSANIDFTAVSSQPEWCTTVVMFYATNNLRITVTKNETFDERQATVVISADGLADVVITVKQSCETPALSVVQENVAISGQEFTLDVNANIPVVFELPEWISEKEGNNWVSGAKKYSFAVTPFTEDVPFREDAVIIRAANSSFEIEPVSVPVRQFSSRHIIIKGTFLQPWLVQNWDDARWDREFKDLQEAGIEYLIFQWSFHIDENENRSAHYPTSLTGNYKDILEICLRNAQNNGIKVFIGLNDHAMWYQMISNAVWLNAQMELGNQVADELIARYKDRYGDTMYGWYWVWEIWNFPSTSDRATIAHAMNINRNHLAEATPAMPFMISPFMNYMTGASDANRQQWEEVFSRVNFREGDIFAPQDCVGAGGLTINMVPDWFSKMKAAVDTKPGLLFWANIENFTQHWTSATLDRYVKQMEQVRPYVSGMITFAYCHYYSPAQVNNKFHDAYVHFYRHGVLPAIAVPPPVSDVVVERGSGKNVVRWNAPQNTETLVGYRIYKYDVQIGEIQCDFGNLCENTFTDTEEGTSSVYTVSAYNVVGGESPKTQNQ